MTREDKLWSMRKVDLLALADKHGIATDLSQEETIKLILKAEQPKTELELFAEQTIKQGGEWHKLEDGLYKCFGKHMVGNNYVNDTPVYQVFNSEGKRVFASVSYTLAYSYYQNMLTS